MLLISLHVTTGTPVMHFSLHVTTDTPVMHTSLQPVCLHG